MTISYVSADKRRAVMQALDTHRWKSMGVSSVECECGEVLRGPETLAQFPADEAFRAHIADVVIAALGFKVEEDR